MANLMTSYNFGRSKASLLNGLIGYFPFNSDLQNKVTFWNIGGFLNPFVAGKIGNATSLNANHTYETIFNFFDGLGNDKPFTISFWVNAPNPTLRMDCLEKSEGLLVEYRMRIASGNIFMLLYTDNFSFITTSKVQTIPANTWVNICFTYDASKTASGIKGYYNASNSGFGSATVGTYTGMTNTSSPLRIGGGTGELYDDFCIWNRVLTPSEVLANYNRTANLI